MTGDVRDLRALLDLLQQAAAIAKRLNFGTLAYLLDLAINEATEQARIFGGTNAPRS